MFTRTNKLKTVFKEAYEGHALDIGITEDNVYVIRGHIFMLTCPAEQIDNEVLAELVKLTGGLPNKGEAVSYVKNDEPQMTDINFLYEDLYEQWEKSEIVVEPTRMMIATEGDVQVVYQAINKPEKLMIPARLHNCIGSARGEWEEKKDIRYTKDGRLVVVSNEMAFRINQHLLKWIPEQEILNACSSIDLNWKSLDINLI